jgi:hypothetical protein
MAMREDLVELSGDDELLFADGFDGALLDVAQRCGEPSIVASDRSKCIELLVLEGKVEEEAEEYFQFNIEGAWVGKRTPAYLARPQEE